MLRRAPAFHAQSASPTFRAISTSAHRQCCALRRGIDIHAGCGQLQQAAQA